MVRSFRREVRGKLRVRYWCLAGCDMLRPRRQTEVKRSVLRRALNHRSRAQSPQSPRYNERAYGDSPKTQSTRRWFANPTLHAQHATIPDTIVRFTLGL